MLVGQLVVSVLVGVLVAVATTTAGLGLVGAVLGYALAIPTTTLLLAARMALPFRS